MNQFRPLTPQEMFPPKILFASKLTEGRVAKPVQVNLDNLTPHALSINIPNHVEKGITKMPVNENIAQASILFSDFIKKYKWPIAIGSCFLFLGTIIYIKNKNDQQKN